MAMIRSNYPEKEALRLAVLAGTDILLYVRATDREVLIDQVVQMVRDGDFTEKDLDERVIRILEKKKTLFTPENSVDLDEIFGETKQHFQ